VRSVFLVHGDLDQAEKLGNGLREKGFARVLIPVRGEKIALD
jgi:hypothetical protein